MGRVNAWKKLNSGRSWWSRTRAWRSLPPVAASSTGVSTSTSSSARQDAPSLCAQPADLKAVLNALFEQNLSDLYAQIEARMFRSVYCYCHGNQLQTTRLLDISRIIVRARLDGSAS